MTNNKTFTYTEITDYIRVLKTSRTVNNTVGAIGRSNELTEVIDMLTYTLPFLPDYPKEEDIYRLYEQNKKLVVEASTISDFMEQINKITKLDHHRGNLKQRLRDMKKYLKYPPALGDNYVITKNTILSENTDFRYIKGSNRSVGKWHLIDITNQTITEYDRLIEVSEIIRCSPSTIQSSIRRDGLCGRSRYAVRRTQADAERILDKYKSPPPKLVRRTICRIDLFREGIPTVIKSMPDFRGLLGLVGCTEKTLLCELRNSNDGELRTLPKTPGYQVRVYFKNCKRKEK